MNTPSNYELSKDFLEAAKELQNTEKPFEYPTFFTSRLFYTPTLAKIYWAMRWNPENLPIANVNALRNGATFKRRKEELILFFLFLHQYFKTDDYIPENQP
jgi:hypothetical protein